MADAELASRCGQNLPPRAVVVPDAQGVWSKLVMIGEESGDTCSDDGSDASDAASDSSTELDDAAVDDAVLCDIAAELEESDADAHSAGHLRGSAAGGRPKLAWEDASKRTQRRRRQDNPATVATSKLARVWQLFRCRKSERLRQQEPKNPLATSLENCARREQAAASQAALAAQTGRGGRRISSGRRRIVRAGTRGRPKKVPRGEQEAMLPPSAHAAAGDPQQQRDVFRHAALQQRKGLAFKLLSVFKAAGAIARLVTIVTVLNLLLSLPAQLPCTLRSACVALGYSWRQLKHVRRFMTTGTLAPETRGGARSSMTLLNVTGVRDSCTLW